MTSTITNLVEHDILKELSFTRNISYFKSLPDELKDSREFILKVLELDIYYFQHISDNLKNDLDIVRVVVSKSGSLLEEAGIAPRSDPEIILNAMSIYTYSFKFASDSIKDNIDMVYKAIDIEPTLFEYASPRLRNDKVLSLYAISKNGFNFSFCSDDLKNNKTIALAAFGNFPQGLELVGPELRADYDVVKLAISNDGKLLKCVDDKFKSNIDIVLDAVYNDHTSLKYSPTFKNDARVLYISERPLYIQESDWPLVKEALLANPDIFVNPPALIKDLIDSMEYPYIFLAQYALTQSNMPTLDNFDIEFIHD